MTETPDPHVRRGRIDKLTGHTAKLTLFVSALFGLITLVLINIPTLVIQWNAARCSFIDCNSDKQAKPADNTSDPVVGAPTTSESVLTPEGRSLQQLVDAINNVELGSPQYHELALQARILNGVNFEFGTITYKRTIDDNTYNGSITYSSYSPAKNDLVFDVTERGGKSNGPLEYTETVRVSVDLDSLARVRDDPERTGFVLECMPSDIPYCITTNLKFGQVCKSSYCGHLWEGSGSFSFYDVSDTPNVRALKKALDTEFYDIQTLFRDF
ncbi:hypothetical protein [Rhizobium tubonense]|uniref:Uncharacterized protein n=1 Tax=Rhizobium tubonense TaxID=484088 RepID=A0A2W4C9W0_9HYPH|nr:hypothetical protein [Rhizobium tubonense]PZM10182.1 hypothetical protein CPY51_23775 [Rhizobium tubonense]